MQKQFLFYTFLLLSSVLFSQKKENLNTEEVTVVKPYTPTVNNALKINTNPVIDSTDILAKKNIQYTILSFPVASTFNPAKGKAKALKKVPKEYFYDNYISLGYGNFSTPTVEIFAHSNTSRYNDFGGFLNYHASGGGIENIQLDDSFLNFGADLFYKQTERDFKWQIDLGAHHQSINWYGLSEKIDFSETFLQSIQEKQTYSDIELGGEIEFFDSLAHRGNVKFSHFFDNTNTNEEYGFIGGVLDFPIGQEMVYTEISFEFLNTNFDSNYNNTNALESTFFNIGFKPSFEILRDNLTINLGAKLYYSLADRQVSKENQFYIYPDITASYKIANDTFIAYGGVTGDLQQNSYKNFVSENPFVSPTLNIQQTSQQFNAFAGIKGLLNEQIRFNFKAAYISETDKPLYLLNTSKTNGIIPVNEGYEAGNSFQVVYDDVNTIKVSGELIMDINEDFKFGGNFEFNSYSLDKQQEAWNLPAIKATLLAKYTAKKWYVGTELFFASERKDLFSTTFTSPVLITNEAYFDINFNGLYNINDKFAVFVNANNILGNNYQEYTNFEVQGLQFLGGITYKFDF